MVIKKAFIFGHVINMAQKITHEVTLLGSGLHIRTQVFWDNSLMQ